MKTLVLEDFGCLQVRERPRPEPSPDDVLVRVTATGICGSDIHGYAGETGRRSRGQVMGHETVGRIETVGSSVSRTDLGLGRLVTFNPLIGCGRCPSCGCGEPHHCSDKEVVGASAARPGAFAEFVTVPADNIVVLPDSMPAEHGALIEPLAVALHAVRRAGLRPGETLLVVGGGPIGQSTVLAGRLVGAHRILASEPNPHRRELLSRLGAEPLDPTTREVRDEVRELLLGPADRAVDAVGLESTLRTSLESVRVGGTVCLAGLSVPRIGLDAYSLSVQERAVVGAFCYTPQDFADAAAFIAGQPSGVEHLISTVAGLDDAPSLFAELAAGQVPAGKVLVQMEHQPSCSA